MRWALLMLVAMATTSWAAEPATRPAIMHQGQKVWIDGIKEVQWGGTGPATLIGCMEAVTAVTAHPVDYDSMQVWSGVAFRIRWYRGLKDNSWHGVSPVVELPEEMAAISRASGWKFEARNVKASAAAGDICKAIDEGRCVLGYVNRTEFDVGFIYGYEDGGKRWMIDDYYGAMRTVPGSDPHDLLFFITWNRPGLSPREAMLQGIRTGLENWNRGEVPADQVLGWVAPGSAKLCYGDAAYGQLIADIEQVEKYSADELGSLRHKRAWVMGNLVSSRESAVRFLRENVELLGDKAADHVMAAADAFDQVAKKVGRAAATRQGFVFDEAWPPEMRKNEIEILRECRTLDEQGINDLEQALDKAEQ